VTHRHPIRSLAALLGSAAVAVIAGASPAAANRAAIATPAAPQSGHLITLVTGERILERAGPNGAVVFSAVSAAATPLVTFEANAVWYVIPDVVIHSLGAQLDATLFDTEALSRAEAASAGQVPVQVRWHGASAPAMPWLVHPVNVSAGVTDGVVTRTSGAVLESSLVAGTLAGIDHISLVGAAPSAPRSSPGFTLYTLTVDGIDLTGAPDNGDIAILVNTDNALNSAGVGFGQWYHGVFKVSVPNGHYSMLGDFAQFSASGGQERLAIINFSVHGNTTVTVDERAATARIVATTPKPTDAGFASVTWQRNSQAPTGGAGFASIWSFGGGAPPFRVYVSPIGAPSFGTQGWIASFHMDSPSTSPSAYSYDLTYGGQGAISADQHYAARASQLATVATRYFSDVAGHPTLEARPSFFPWQFFAFGSFDAFNAPFDRTEYVRAAPDLLWLQQVVADANTFSGMSQDSEHVFVRGATSTADWNREPIGPGVFVDTGAAATFPILQGCPACTESGMLELAIFPFGDNPPGHVGLPNFPTPGLTETDAYTLLRNETVISTGQDPLGISVPVPSGAANFKLQYSVAMTAPWRTLSTNETTAWSFSSPGSTSAPPPPGWVCFSGTNVGCGVVALMLPDYQLPEDGTGHVASGPVTFRLGISHILGVPIAVTSAAVSISFNGGSTWVTAHVTPSGANAFAVSYTDPSHAGTAAIRIHVTDARGGALDQTILNAYAFP
jgi:hypothetical protein